jgi:hypothetical protein
MGRKGGRWIKKNSIEHKQIRRRRRRRRRKSRKERSWEKEEMRDTHFHLCKKLKTPSPGWWEGIKLGVVKWCSLWLCCPPSYCCCSPFWVRICRWLLFVLRSSKAIIGSHIKTNWFANVTEPTGSLKWGRTRLGTSQPNSTRLHMLTTKYITLRDCKTKSHQKNPLPDNTLS